MRKWLGVCVASFIAVIGHEAVAQQLAFSPWTTNSCNAGWKALGARDYRKAISSYTNCLESADLNTRQRTGVLTDRGKAYLRTGKYVDAINDYTDALTLKPRLHRAYNGRGIAYWHQGWLGLAIEDFSQAIRLKPSEIDYVNHRGLAHYHKGDFDAASGDHGRALQLDPKADYTALWLFLANARIGPDARKRLEQDAAKLDLKQWPGPLIEMVLGRLSRDDAWKRTERASTRSRPGQQCEVAYYAGELLELERRVEAAAREYQFALHICPKTYIEYIAANVGLKRIGH